MPAFIQLTGPGWRCDSIHATSEMKPVLENIVSGTGAFIHALSWIFSRQKFLDTGLPVSHGFRRDGLVRKAGRMAVPMFSTSCHPLLLKRQRVVFQPCTEARTYDHHQAQSGPSGQHAHDLPQPNRPPRSHRSSAYRGALLRSQGQRPRRREPLYPGHEPFETVLRRIADWRCQMNAIKLPRWASLLLAAGCIAIGLWSSVVTLKFFEHGAAALESDPALQALAKAAAYLFVAAEMSAFILAALIVGREFMVRRMSLYVYAAVVVIVEVFTISAIQIAGVVGADMTQANVSESLSDLRKQIAAAEAQAATYTDNATSLRASDQRSKAAQQTDKATAATDKAAALYASLGTARAAKHPTLSANLGGTLAIGYAIIRGLLVPATGLIFFGAAGALMLRRADGVSVEERILMALSRVEGAPAALPVATMQAAPVVPAVSFKIAQAVAPKDASTGLSYSAKTALAGAGALAALTVAPTVMAAPAAPAVPANAVSKTIHAAVSETIHLQSVNTANSDASNAAPASLETAPAGVSKPIHAGVSETIQQIVKKPRAKRAVSAKIDTGVEGKAGARFKRIRDGVKAGKIRPSVRGIQAVEGGSQEVVADYLQQLETEGVIIKSGRGYALANKGGAK